MRSIYLISSALLFRNISGIEQNMAHLDSHLSINIYNEILFANSGSTNRTNKSEEIRDESGLGSGAGITPESQPVFAGHQSQPDSDPDASSFTADDGATGPGSDRSGDKMPGEDGITSLTDGIARFIDDAEDDDKDSTEDRRKQ